MEISSFYPEGVLPPIQVLISPTPSPLREGVTGQICVPLILDYTYGRPW